MFDISPELHDIIDYTLRLSSRLGFCILLISLYRVYHFFASPLVKKKHKKPIIIFGASAIASLALLVVNYIIPSDWLSTIAMTFSTLMTYALAIYLYHQGNLLEAYKCSDEFRALSRAMDSLILVLKTR